MTQPAPQTSGLGHFTEAITKKYAKFGGRARRSEFWFFMLGLFLLTFITGFVDGIAGFKPTPDMPITPITTLALLVTLLPMLSVTTRRLHDAGRSGWWLLTYFVPLLGWLWLLYLLTMDSQQGPNKWGPSPKYPDANLSATPEVQAAPH